MSIQQTKQPQATSNNQTPTQASNTHDISPMPEFEMDISDPEHILHLQRTIGNHATARLLQPTRNKTIGNGFADLKMASGSVPNALVQRDPDPVDDSDFAGLTTGAISLGDEFDEDDEDEDYDDEDVTEETLPHYREQYAKMGVDKFTSRYDSEIVLDLTEKLAEIIVAEGKDAVTSIELDLVIDRFSTTAGYFDKSLKEQLLEAMPDFGDQIEALKESKAAELRQSDYDWTLNFMRTDDLSASNIAHYIKIYGWYHEPPPDFPYATELKELLNTPKWSWMLSGTLSSRGDLTEIVEAKIMLDESRKDADKVKTDAMTTAIGGASGTSAVINQVLTVAEAGETLAKIGKDTDGKDMMMGVGLENLGMWLTGKAFASLSIGMDLLKAFVYHKRRRDGYKAGMDRAGIDTDGKTDIEPTSAENLMKLANGEIAYYAYNKTKRAFNSTIIKMSLKVVKWIAYAITLLSGGTSALVSGVIALSADIARSLINLGQKMKGLWKAIAGTRGANRKKYAKQLVIMATEGNDDAIQTIWDVNPFDEARGVTKEAWNETGGRIFGKSSTMTTLPKPESLEAFKAELPTYNGKQQNVIINAVATTMKST
jgi:hypothetical protein